MDGPDDKRADTRNVAHLEVARPEAQWPSQSEPKLKPVFLGQTKAAWYIYWICAVASIANMYV